jgi:hypothetical protein
MLAGSDRNYYASVTGTADLIHCVEQDGFAIVFSCLNEELTQSLAAQLREGSYAKRNLLALPIVHLACPSEPRRDGSRKALFRRQGDILQQNARIELEGPMAPRPHHHGS